MNRPGARAYYLRRILHDYPDKECELILSQIAKSMVPDSRVLIADVCLPARATEAELNAVMIDQIMIMMAGKERTEEMFKQFFANSGLELVKAWRPEVGAAALVEARLTR